MTLKRASSILFVLGLCLRQLVSKSSAAGITAIATTLLGLMYVPWLLNFISEDKFFPGRRGKILPALLHPRHHNSATWALIPSARSLAVTR